ncbi:hypothetical protein A0J51_02980 [Gluconobacter japonicus]|nr:hypothetical protein A0J51_02980 [Gluconobacter japonicus]
MTEEERDETNAAMRQWRQGDFIVGLSLPAIHLADLSCPGTKASREMAEGARERGEDLGLEAIAVDFSGIMVTSQTCDIVRCCSDRELIEFCPLVLMAETHANAIKRGQMPRYLWCDGMGSFAADLDRVCSVEKRALAKLSDQRQSGGNVDHDRRRIAETLGRKRSRSALPDDFVDFLRPIQKRVIGKHNKDSPEGACMRALREIRVRPDKDWNDAPKNVAMFFIFQSRDEISDDFIEKLEDLINLVSTDTRYSIEGIPICLKAMSAEDYLDTDKIDFDHLSAS